MLIKTNKKLVYKLVVIFLIFGLAASKTVEDVLWGIK